MNTRPKSQGDKSPSDKSQGGKAGYFKQQPKRTIAAATGAPRREDAMLAATEPVQKQARHVLERAFESIELSFRAAKLGTVAVKSQADRHRADQCLVELDLAIGLATAKTPMETAQLQMAFFDQHIKTLAAQSAGAQGAARRDRRDHQRAAPRARQTQLSLSGATSSLRALSPTNAELRGARPARPSSSSRQPPLTRRPPG